METGVYDFVGDSFQVVGDPHSVRDETANVLVGHDVPDSVACQHQELVGVFVSCLDVKLGLWRHQLLCWTLPFHVLVLKVSESPGIL